MSATSCRHLTEVRSAARSGVLTEDLRRHSAECAECGEESLVASFFARLSSETADLPRLPDAATVWRSSLLLSRRSAERRLLRAMTIVTRVAWASGATAAALVAFQMWPLAWPKLAALVGAYPIPSPPSFAVPGGPLLLAAGLGVLLAVAGLEALDTATH